MPPDANTIALVSVILTGSTAVLAPAFTGWRDRRRYVHEREASDVAELRSLLDEAAGVLGDVLDALSIDSGATAEDRFRQLTRDRASLFRLSGRIAMRLGSHHPVFHACESATTAVEQLVRLLDDATPEGPGLQEQILARYESFDSARDDFFDAAERVIGARIKHDARGVLERAFDGDLTPRERLTFWWSDRRFARLVRKTERQRTRSDDLLDADQPVAGCDAA